MNVISAPIDRHLSMNIGDVSTNILTIGRGSYAGDFGVSIFDKSPHVLIGRFCSLADKIHFLIGGNHPYKNVSSFPFDVDKIIEQVFGNGEPIVCNRPNHYQIIVGHDVWIGRGVTIMGGVKIGNGAVIGAGAVVAKNIPPYAIAVGNPARVVKYRFDEETIKKLLAVKWWNWDLKKIADNFPLMNDVEKFLAAHYSPELEKIPEDVLGQHIKDIRVGGGYAYNFIADFRAKNPLWLRVVAGFCQSKLENALLVIWQDKNSTEKDAGCLNDFLHIFKSNLRENVLMLRAENGENFSPYAIRQGTHFITTREMTTLEVLDYLWNTDVKIVSALDDGIFDGEPPIDWNTFLK